MTFQNINSSSNNSFINSSNFILPAKSITAIEKDILSIIPEAILMENAANRFINRLENYININDKIAVVAGPGNNGGDGLAIARLLISKDYNVDIFIPNDISKYSETTLKNLEILQHFVKIRNRGAIYSLDLLAHNSLFIDAENYIKHNDNMDYNIDIDDLEYNNKFNKYSVIIDALFGIGLNREISGHYKDIINNMNNSHGLVFSVDIPSGLLADSCEHPKIAVHADYTITFSVSKYALCGYPAKKYAGQIFIENISIPNTVFHDITTDFLITKDNIIKTIYKETINDVLDYYNLFKEESHKIAKRQLNHDEIYYELIHHEEKMNQMPIAFKDFRKFIFSNNLLANHFNFHDTSKDESSLKKEKDFMIDQIINLYLSKRNIRSISNIINRDNLSYKGTYGKVGLIGGSSKFLGALKIAGISARRFGAGLITCIHPSDISRDFISDFPEIMTSTFDYENGWSLSIELNQKMDAISIGNGMGIGGNLKKFINDYLDKNLLPTVIDADGLNNLSLEEIKNHAKHNNSIVITPHLGEFSKLLNIPLVELNKNKFQIAKDFSKNFNITLVLKSADTLIATPSGYAYSIAIGNSGLSQGGTGDALTGAITSLLGQGFNPTVASILAIYLIGRSSEIIVESNSEAYNDNKALSSEFISGNFTITEILKYIHNAVIENI